MTEKTPFFISPAYSVPRITISMRLKLISTEVVEDMPLETFQSEGQSYLVVPENATPLQCTTPSGRKAICLHMTNGD